MKVLYTAALLFLLNWASSKGIHNDLRRSKRYSYGDTCPRTSCSERNNGICKMTCSDSEIEESDSAYKCNTFGGDGGYGDYGGYGANDCKCCIPGNDEKTDECLSLSPPGFWIPGAFPGAPTCNEKNGVPTGIVRPGGQCCQKKKTDECLSLSPPGFWIPAAFPGAPTCNEKNGVPTGIFQIGGQCCQKKTAPCPNNGESCGRECTCRTVCEQGELDVGFCPTTIKDLVRCRKCRKVAVEPVGCPGGFCKSTCDWDAGEYVGPFGNCGSGQYCCNSPETAPCANNGESCGRECTCRTVCEQGENDVGFCPTLLQDVGRCRKCRKDTSTDTCPRTSCSQRNNGICKMTCSDSEIEESDSAYKCNGGYGGDGGYGGYGGNDCKCCIPGNDDTCPRTSCSERNNGICKMTCSDSEIEESDSAYKCNGGYGGDGGYGGYGGNDCKCCIPGNDEEKYCTVCFLFFCKKIKC